MVKTKGEGNGKSGAVQKGFEDPYSMGVEAPGDGEEALDHIAPVDRPAGILPHATKRQIRLEVLQKVLP